MSEWRIIIEAWPYSTGQSQEKAQAEIEPRQRCFDIRANDYSEAHRAAMLLMKGIQSCGKVWRAVIKEVRETRA